MAERDVPVEVPRHMVALVKRIAQLSRQQAFARLHFTLKAGVRVGPLQIDTTEEIAEPAGS